VLGSSGEDCAAVARAEVYGYVGVVSCQASDGVELVNPATLDDTQHFPKVIRDSIVRLFAA
jgi:hypothetical protein